MSFVSLILINAAILCVPLGCLWIVSVLKKDASIIDVFWGAGFVVVAWSTLLQQAEVTLRSGLLAGLVTVWGMRLAIYLGWRKYGEEEDRRYAKMRERFGDSFWWVSLFVIFLLQGALMWFISLTVQSGMHFSQPDGIGWVAAVGIALWCTGLFFETVGDYQMARFKARDDSDGEVMNKGLWRYTRHPNYFGDFCVWWGIYLVAGPAASWWTIASPLVMAFLLLKVSGVSMLENDIEERRPGYAEYKRRTNAFFPGPVSKP